MTAGSDTTVKLGELMALHGLTGKTCLLRQTLAEFLEPLDEPAAYRISANPDPSESIVDVYAGGHVGLAVHVGAGLAFAEWTDQDWTADDRVSVEVRLQDVLDQGGLIYPVESVITNKVWYVTLPEGGVRVRKVGT